MKYLQYRRAMCRYIKELPIELTVGVLGALLGALGLLILQWSGLSELSPEMVNDFVLKSLICLGLAGLLIVSVHWKEYLLRMKGVLFYGMTFLLFQVYFFFYFGLYILVVSFAFAYPIRDWVAQVSLQYLRLDTTWGVYDMLYPAVAFFTEYPVLLRVVNFAYAQTAIVMFIGLLLVSFCSMRLTRQYLLAFFFSSLLATVVWILLPAVAPYQLATSEKFIDSPYYEQINTETQSVVLLYETFTGTQWGTSVEAYTAYWRNITADFGYASSSNPSMHIIWGVLLTVYLWRAYPLFGAVAALYAVVESIGTMLFLQHYFIDIPVGFLFALLSIWVAGKLDRAEDTNKHFDKVLWFTPLVLAEKVGIQARNWLKNKLSAH